jgi:UDP-N-acetylmuramate dehydrogenase
LRSASLLDAGLACTGTSPAADKGKHGVRMKVRQQYDLTHLNTFGVPARAPLLFEIENEEDLLEAPGLRPGQDLLLGGGSNLLLLADGRRDAPGQLPGHVLLNRIRGIALLDQDQDSVLVEVGAGENWHELVRYCLQQGWHGLENLALIPGLTGAAPVQNIGAYGVELAEVLEAVTAWDWQEARWLVFGNSQCALGYRDSVFRHEPRDRYFITSIRLRLQRQFEAKVDYAGLRESLGKLPHTAENVFNSVVTLRRKKLPDPALHGNAGSFFKNPVLEAAGAAQLLQQHPALPNWPAAHGGVKLSAAAMIDSLGLKGLQRGAAAVSQQHALVLVNRGGASGMDIWGLALEVQQRVQDHFGIVLEPEPRIFPAPG